MKQLLCTIAKLSFAGLFHTYVPDHLQSEAYQLYIISDHLRGDAKAIVIIGHEVQCYKQCISNQLMVY